MTNINTLRIAAIMAVISASSSAEDISQVGRLHGESWSEDHRRINMGMSSLMHKRSSRSTWR
ncbi:MAG: hypothetical protein CMB20_000950 [Methanobacteriota archaeon]|nr:MAG: hypothetical protein CMB20_000950 [Euryarchaeota archaeon]|tara:strand:- start:335 stop:520 length:186 start_codon:yes stop_codon:yes gene_type:complete